MLTRSCMECRRGSRGDARSARPRLFLAWLCPIWAPHFTLEHWWHPLRPPYFQILDPLLEWHTPASRICWCHFPETLGLVSSATHCSWLPQWLKKLLADRLSQFPCHSCGMNCLLTLVRSLLLNPLKMNSKLICLGRAISADCMACFNEHAELLTYIIMVGVHQWLDRKCYDQPVWIQRPNNGVRRPRQIRGPKIRANVPPKGPCWRHRVCHLGAIVVAWAARGRLGVGRV